MNKALLTELTESHKPLTGESPPCEKFQCCFYDQCKNQKQCCESFLYYVKTGRSVSPKTVWVCKKPVFDQLAGPTPELFKEMLGC